jgi:hypothetical protein
MLCHSVSCKSCSNNALADVASADFRGSEDRTGEQIILLAPADGRNSAG